MSMGREPMNSEGSEHVRLGAHNGLKSDNRAKPKSTGSGHLVSADRVNPTCRPQEHGHELSSGGLTPRLLSLARITKCVRCERHNESAYSGRVKRKDGPICLAMPIAVEFEYLKSDDAEQP